MDKQINALSSQAGLIMELLPVFMLALFSVESVLGTTRRPELSRPKPPTGGEQHRDDPPFQTTFSIVLLALLVVAVIVIVILVVLLCRQRSRRQDNASGNGVVLNTRVKARGQGIALYVTPASSQHVPIGPPERHTWRSPQNDLSAVSSGHYEEVNFNLHALTSKANETKA